MIFTAEEAALYERELAHPCATCNGTKKPRWVEVAPGEFAHGGWECPGCGARASFGVVSRS